MIFIFESTKWQLDRLNNSIRYCNFWRSKFPKCFDSKDNIRILALKNRSEGLLEINKFVLKIFKPFVPSWFFFYILLSNFPKAYNRISHHGNLCRKIIGI